jgi:hypothetical protein
MGAPYKDTLCAQCQTLIISLQPCAPHKLMQPITQLDDVGRHGYEMLFRCKACDTLWLYQEDKWQTHLGFKLWPGSLADYIFDRPHDNNQLPPRMWSAIIKGLKEDEPLH